MAVIHLIFSLGIGGAENLLVDIANEQANTEKVTIIIINSRVDSKILQRIDSRVEVVFLNRKEGSKLDYYFLVKLWYYLIIRKPKVIHCHNHNVISLLPFFRSKAVITVHDVGDPIENLPKFKKVFSISNAVKDELTKLNISSHVVNNGINFLLYNRRKAYEYCGSTLFKVVQVSRLMHQKKGQDVLLLALSKLVYDYGIKNISLDFVGVGNSLEYLQNLTNRLNLSDHVNFCLDKDRIWIQRNLCNYHLLVQPSRYEGFGLTIIEAIAAGLPVIATAIDGPAEILKNVPSGILFENENVDELANALRKVMELYKACLIDDLCANSFTRVADKYSVHKTANEYLENYTMI